MKRKRRAVDVAESYFDLLNRNYNYELLVLVSPPLHFFYYLLVYKRISSTSRRLANSNSAGI